jgi:hypothetical protein
MRTAVQRVALMIGLLVAGCDNDGPVPIDDPAAFLAVWPEVNCSWRTRCGLFDSVAECAAFDRQLTDTTYLGYTPVDERLPYAVRRGTVTYDADAAGRCIAALRTQSCSWYDRSAAACDEVFAGTAAAGAPVAHAFECIVPFTIEGEHACDDACCTQTCASTTIILVPEGPGVEGSPCTMHGDCSLETTCHHGQCTDPDRIGDVCIKAHADDATGHCANMASLCIDDRCQRHGFAGDRCDDEVGAHCAPGLLCDATIDRCVGFVAEGQPCGYAGGALCGPGLACNPTTDVCAPLLADAASCETGWQCASGHCSSLSHTCGHPVACP